MAVKWETVDPHKIPMTFTVVFVTPTQNLFYSLSDLAHLVFVIMSTSMPMTDRVMSPPYAMVMVIPGTITSRMMFTASYPNSSKGPLDATFNLAPKFANLVTQTMTVTMSMVMA